MGRKNSVWIPCPQFNATATSKTAAAKHLATLHAKRSEVLGAVALCESDDDHLAQVDVQVQEATAEAHRAARNIEMAREASAGGPLALVKNGDRITLDVTRRSLHLPVNDEELAQRRGARTAAKLALDSGYWKLYVDQMVQADEGVDLDFLRGKRGAFIPRDSHRRFHRQWLRSAIA